MDAGQIGARTTWREGASRVATPHLPTHRSDDAGARPSEAVLSGAVAQPHDGAVGRAAGPEVSPIVGSEAVAVSGNALAANLPQPGLRAGERHDHLAQVSAREEVSRGRRVPEHRLAAAGAEAAESPAAMVGCTSYSATHGRR